MGLFKNSKVNKKYIFFIESVVYVILGIVIIFSNIAGPIVIKMLPLLLILGIVGRVIFDRTLITSVFGFLISLCITYLTGAYSFKYVILYSLFCFVSILLGELAGVHLIRFKKSTSKKFTSKNTYDLSICVLIAVFSVYINNYVNGNIYTYINAKNIIGDYIKLNYSESKDVNIEGAKYVFSDYSYYSFNVKNISQDDDKIYKFAVYEEDKIIDGYYDKNLSNKTKVLKANFSSKINLNKYTNYHFDIKYHDLNNNITFYVTKNVDDINDKELNKFAEEVNTILDDISNYDKFSDIKKMTICIKSDDNINEADIYSTNFYDKAYYLDSLETEYLDK